MRKVKYFVLYKPLECLVVYLFHKLCMWLHTKRIVVPSSGLRGIEAEFLDGTIQLKTRFD